MTCAVCGKPALYRYASGGRFRGEVSGRCLVHRLVLDEAEVRRRAACESVSAMIAMKGHARNKAITARSKHIHRKGFT